jgi:hypothetical protein
VTKVLEMKKSFAFTRPDVEDFVYSIGLLADCCFSGFRMKYPVKILVKLES